jgi:hypothetical protein
MASARILAELTKGRISENDVVGCDTSRGGPTRDGRTQSPRAAPVASEPESGTREDQNARKRAALDEGLRRAASLAEEQRRRNEHNRRRARVRELLTAARDAAAAEEWLRAEAACREALNLEPGDAAVTVLLDEVTEHLNQPE